MAVRVEGCNNRTLSPYTDGQCKFMESVVVIDSFLNVFGLILHAYVIFAYSYNRDVFGKFTAHQLLVMGFSVYDFICCLSSLLNLFSYRITDDEQVRCGINAIYTVLSLNIVYMVGLLLYVNRYYSICRPMSYFRVFSPLRLCGYFVVIGSCAFIQIGAAFFGNCVVLKWLGEGEDSFWGYKIFMPIFLSLVNLFYFVFFFLIFGLYVKIIRRIEVNVKYLEQDNIDNILDEDIQDEKSKSKSITVFFMLFQPMLLVSVVDLTYYQMCVFFRLDAFLHGDGRYRLNFITFLLAVPNALIFIVNPVNFYFTNPEFSMRMKAPWRGMFTHDLTHSFKLHFLTNN